MECGWLSSGDHSMLSHVGRQKTGFCLFDGLQML